MPGEFFIGILNQDYLPIILDKIYNDSTSLNMGKTKYKRLEEVLKLKVKK
jgi:hypothetical protein